LTIAVFLLIVLFFGRAFSACLPAVISVLRLTVFDIQWPPIFLYSFRAEERVAVTVTGATALLPVFYLFERYIFAILFVRYFRSFLFLMVTVILFFSLFC
jgi:hypothetical protein